MCRHVGVVDHDDNDDVQGVQQEIVNHLELHSKQEI